MKLVTFGYDGVDRVGVVRGDSVVAVDVPDMRTLFELGEAGMDMARGADGPMFRMDQVKLKAPIIPKKFFHTAGNFREHADEGDRSGWVAQILPWIIFFQNVDSIIGPEDDVIYPEHLTDELDYEMELAVVIKKAGKHFSPDEAGEYIGGYVIFNDITARDIQRREMESKVFTFCKSIDTFSPLGPYIVTPDEIADPRNLKMELRVNGEVRQSSSSRNMAVTVEEVLAHYSPLGYSAGDIVSLGTVSGVAAFSEDPQAWYLKPGDVMEAEIEGLGILRNRVVSWKDAYGEDPPPRIRW